MNMLDKREKKPKRVERRDSESLSESERRLARVYAKCSAHAE